MKRRLFVVFLVVIVAFAGITTVRLQADVEDDIGVSYRVSESKINKNEYFTIYLSFTDIGGVSNVYVNMINNDFFKVTSGSLIINNAAFGDKEYSFNLQYLGGSDKLPLSISYDIGRNHKTGTKNVTIDEINEDSVSIPTGSSDSEPKLIIESTSIPSAAAGDTMKIPLTITNESRYSAKTLP